jgi:hypothetical protein
MKVILLVINYYLVDIFLTRDTGLEVRPMFYKLYMGSNIGQQSLYIYDVDYWVNHMEFEISVVRVKTKIEPILDDDKYLINTVCLPLENQLNNEKEEAVYAGWGEYDYRPGRMGPSYELRKAKIDIGPVDDCRRHQGFNYDYHICSDVDKWISCGVSMASGDHI